jgi:hypothetical protein
MSPLFAFGGY